MTDTPVIFWVIFNVAVLALLGLDLFLHRKPRVMGALEAGAWSAFWISLSLAFNLFLWWWKGPQHALEFLTGYLVEYSLSVDNIFVFVLIFGYFRVPAEHQHRVLFWGIIGALVMRGLMIWLGVTLIESFHWILYVFGAFLIVTGLRMLKADEAEIDPEHNPLVRVCIRLFPMTRSYHGPRFTVRSEGRIFLTPLALVLVMVESTDLLFALDSIPAIIAITKSPFIIYTSNVCAILGLRSLYFLLASSIQKFVYLRYGLAAILTFIGSKMLLSHWVEIPTSVSLLVIAALLAGSVAASIFLPHRRPRP